MSICPCKVKGHLSAFHQIKVCTVNVAFSSVPNQSNNTELHKKLNVNGLEANSSNA